MIDRFAVGKTPGKLRKPEEFEAVLKAGIRATSRNFVARAISNGRPQPRLGLIAGRKAAPRAVDRNRCKRLVRVAFREAAGHIGAVDVTIQLRSDLQGVLNAAIRDELRTLFQSVARRCGALPRESHR